MSKPMTISQMKATRACGLKYYDAAAAKIGHAALLAEAVKIAKQFPNIWGPGWPNLNWAFVNAVINTLNPKCDICQSYDLEDVLSPTEISQLQVQFNCGPFTRLRARKP